MEPSTWEEVIETKECGLQNERVEVWGDEEGFALRIKDCFLEIGASQQADVDVWMVLLNAFRGPDGQKVVTLVETAQAFGYQNRQDVDNRAQRYRGAGNSIAGVLAPWLTPRRVLTPELQAAIESLAINYLQASAEELLHKLVAQGTIRREDAPCLNTIYDALEQADFHKLRQRVRRQLEDGSIQYKEDVLLARLFELLESQQELLEQSGLVHSAAVCSVEELKAMLPSKVAANLADQPPTPHTAFGYSVEVEDLHAFLFEPKADQSTARGPTCPDCHGEQTTKKSSQTRTLSCGKHKRQVSTETRRCGNPECERKVFTVSEKAKEFWLELSLQVLLHYAYFRSSFGRIASFYGMSKSTTYTLFCTFGRASVHAMLEVYGPGAHFSGVLVIDEKWIKIPKHFRAKGLKRKFAFGYVAVDPHTMDLVHCEVFENNNQEATKAFLWQLRAKGYRPIAIVTDGLESYATAIPEVFRNTTHHLCIWHFLRNVNDKLRKLFGEDARKLPAVKDLRKSISRIFACKDKRTAQKRFEAVLARREEFLTLHPRCAEILEALKRDYPKLVNCIGSRLIPKTTNAAELLIRQFAAHYKTMAGFETLEGARTQFQLFALVYRFTPFTDKARKAWRGLCPLEIAGYPVQDCRLYKMLRAPLADNIIELAVSPEHEGEQVASAAA